MRLVGHHCCARGLLTSGFCKKIFLDYKNLNDIDTINEKLSSNSQREDDSIGLVNSLHKDTCDLIKKALVTLYIEKFTKEISNNNKIKDRMKRKLISKVEEIKNLVGLGLPTTCAYNIICRSILMETSSLSAFFIMFDFAMPLNHKRVHNFFGWSFLHCTALPILIFDNGRVHLSNEHAEEEDCLVIFV